MPEDASREELMAYHNLLHQQHARLAAAQAELDKRKQLADASSERRARLSSLHSSASQHNSAGRVPKRRSRVQHLPEDDMLELSKSLDSSFMTVDSAGDLMAKTPQGALIAATTYLLSN